MTFYHLKAIKGSTKYLGITTGPVKYVSSGSRYKTKFIKLEKLTDDEKMSFQTGHERDYIWPKLKDEKFWKGWGDWLGTRNKPGAQPGNKNWKKKLK